MIHTGVPQGSKLSPTLFSFYIADMPRPTEPVKRICYVDDITVWASGVEISELEHKVNTYLTEMSRFLRENSLLISAITFPYPNGDFILIQRGGWGAFKNQPACSVTTSSAQCLHTLFVKMSEISWN